MGDLYKGLAVSTLAIGTLSFGSAAPFLAQTHADQDKKPDYAHEQKHDGYGDKKHDDKHDKGDKKHYRFASYDECVNYYDRYEAERSQKLDVKESESADKDVSVSADNKRYGDWNGSAKSYDADASYEHDRDKAVKLSSDEKVKKSQSYEECERDYAKSYDKGHGHGYHEKDKHYGRDKHVEHAPVHAVNHGGGVGGYGYAPVVEAGHSYVEAPKHAGHDKAGPHHDVAVVKPAGHDHDCEAVHGKSYGYGKGYDFGKKLDFDFRQDASFHRNVSFNKSFGGVWGYDKSFDYGKDLGKHYGGHGAVDASVAGGTAWSGVVGFNADIAFDANLDTSLSAGSHGYVLKNDVAVDNASKVDVLAASQTASVHTDAVNASSGYGHAGSDLSSGHTNAFVDNRAIVHSAEQANGFADTHVKAVDFGNTYGHGFDAKVPAHLDSKPEGHADL